jgi:hypothetical protein
MTTNARAVAAVVFDAVGFILLAVAVTGPGSISVPLVLVVVIIRVGLGLLAATHVWAAWVIEVTRVVNLLGLSAAMDRPELAILGAVALGVAILLGARLLGLSRATV